LLFHLDFGGLGGLLLLVSQFHGDLFTIWAFAIDLCVGLAFPPLYFNNGGVREFLATLKSHAILVRLVTKIAFPLVMIFLLHILFPFISRSEVYPLPTWKD
jgi:hypothetical protein